MTSPLTRMRLAILLVPLLGLYVVLQTHWLDELAAAELERTPGFLANAAERMAGECQAILADVADAVIAGRAHADPVAATLVAELVELAPDEERPRDLPAFVVQRDGGPRLLVVLDPEQLRVELFPALARKALGADNLATYRVAVVHVGGGTPPLYRSAPADARDREPPDATAELALVANRWVFHLKGGDASWTIDPTAEREDRDGPVWVVDGDAGDGLPGRPGPAEWRIEVRHRDGPLEDALARARTRNLLLAGGLLALVVAGLTLLWVAEQRARRLAEKELAFVAGVSHELRTPLAVVRTAASNLGRGVVRDPVQVAEYGALIERETTRLATLVERVLRFSGAETPLVLDEVDVEAVIRAAVERCRPWRDRKHYEVAVDVAPDARAARADAAALTSALHNLIENAIKYGGDGQTIRVRARRDAGLLVEVADTGPGVAVEDRQRLFQPFYRGASARASNLPGSGLGLAVARDIARAHGGRLELREDEPGARGAVFVLHLPAPPGGAGDEAPV